MVEDWILIVKVYRITTKENVFTINENVLLQAKMKVLDNVKVR